MYLVDVLGFVELGAEPLHRVAWTKQLPEDLFAHSPTLVGTKPDALLLGLTSASRSYGLTELRRWKKGEWIPTGHRSRRGPYEALLALRDNRVLAIERTGDTGPTTLAWAVGTGSQPRAAPAPAASRENPATAPCPAALLPLMGAVAPSGKVLLVGERCGADSQAAEWLDPQARSLGPPSDLPSSDRLRVNCLSVRSDDDAWLGGTTTGSPVSKVAPLGQPWLARFDGHEWRSETPPFAVGGVAAMGLAPDGTALVGRGTSLAPSQPSAASWSDPVLYGRSPGGGWSPIELPDHEDHGHYRPWSVEGVWTPTAEDAWLLVQYCNLDEIARGGRTYCLTLLLRSGSTDSVRVPTHAPPPEEQGRAEGEQP
jgi:hypothetical protein